MKFSSLFSGAGGLDLGLEQAGHELLFLCESDPGARQVLKERFPGVRLAHDVCAVESLPAETELLVAGFPCIDVSRAGLRKGLEGQSSGLVRHVFRLLETAKLQRRPVNWVLLENVEALLDRIDDQPPPIAYVVQQLMDLGYSSWAYRVISSAGFGVPMRRRRVFIVASIHGDARDVLLSQGMQECPGACKELFEGNPCYSCHKNMLQRRNSNDNVSFAIDLGSAICKPGEDIVPSLTTSNDRVLLLLSDGRQGMLRIEDTERLQGFSEGWTKSCFPVTGEGLSAHKRMHSKEADSETHLYKRWQLLGNAVTVQVARWLGERLMKPYSHKYRLATGNYSIRDLVYENSKNSSFLESSKKRQNIWSFVTADEIQEAALFSFKNSNEFKRAKIQEIQASESTKIKLDERNGSESSEINKQRDCDSESAKYLTTPDSRKESSNRNRSISSSEDTFDIDVQPFKDRFQAKMFTKIKKGLVQSPWKDRTHAWEKTSWPKCGWWIRGVGEFGVMKWSEYPVLCPFQNLAEFIEQVGRSATSEERAGYVHRLKEKGWDISGEVLDRISGSKGSIASKSAGISRISGLLDDSEMVGEIVWAPDALSGEYWPGEVLDPSAMPLGRTFPKDSLNMLTAEQKRASVPSLSRKWNQPDHADSEHRRVLVLYFPITNGKWQWYHPVDLLPWEENRVEYEKKAHAAMKGTGFKYKELLGYALQDARESHGVKNKKNSMTTSKMRQTRAAAAAASVDLKSRCGRCRTCMNAYVGTKRHDCLTQRMTASALGGHAGAQIAICGENAIGARIAVWWEGDEEYFEGVICWYDPVSTEHTVAYDDGEIGMHRLWQHDEHIIIKSGIEEWPAEAVAVRERLKRAMQEPLTEAMSAEDILNNKRASELAARMPQPTNYEKERHANIQNIRDQFKIFMGVDDE